jgi:hypothetical protein
LRPDRDHSILMLRCSRGLRDRRAGRNQPCPISSSTWVLTHRPSAERL